MKIHADSLTPVVQIINLTIYLNLNVLDFINNFIGEDEAKQFSEICGTSFSSISDNPLVKAGGFSAMLKEFLKKNPGVKEELQKLSKELQNNSQKLKVEEVIKKANSAKPEVETKKAKETKKKSESSSDSDDSDVSEEKTKPQENKLSGVKRTHKEVEKKSEESDDSSDSSESDEIKVAQKPGNGLTNGTTNAKKQKSEDEDDDDDDDDEVEEAQATNNKSKTVPFSRIKENYASNLSREFQDNTFEAKAKYGQGGDDFGVHSNQKLKVVKGKDFRKEKTKMKKKNFHGAGSKLVYKVNSVKF